MEYKVTFAFLPKNVEEMKRLPEAQLQTPEGTAALTVLALCRYPESKEDCIAMLDYLRGPRPLSIAEKQFLTDRFRDTDYVPRSYLEGATPDNAYSPQEPYVVRMKDSAAQFAEEGYVRMDLYSGGADSPRQVTLRTKPSTGEWFLWEQMLLAGIRVPTEQDPWA